MTDVTLKIDGVQLIVPAGANIVDAARTVGIEIPIFCYHPRMKPVGMCRMCLVEVWVPKLDPATRQPTFDSEGKPVMSFFMNKLQTACTAVVGESMEVRTQTERVKEAQRGVLEFLLTSHPLDCPVCDKGGECPLQNLTMAWGPSISRFDYSDKAHFKKPIPLGDLIYLDRERCILCGRCVRFEDEIADDQVLGFDYRGRNWQIISKSDPPFDSKLSGNTTDICPVGALTTADFRFRARVWEVSSKPSLCLHCSTGCNVTLDMRHNQLKRVMPRENAAVNDIWICDKGRFGQRFIESPERLMQPLIRRGERLEPATWDEALSLVGENLTAIQRKHKDALAGLAGERLSNEDLYLFQRLFREVLGSNNIDHRSGAPGEPHADDLGALMGVGVGTNLMELGANTAVLAFGVDPEEEAPLYLVRLRGIAQRGGKLITVNPRSTKLDRSATQKLRYTPGSEHHVARALVHAIFAEAGMDRIRMRVSDEDKFRAALKGASIVADAAAAGLSEEAVREAARSFVEAENGIIIYGAEALAAGSSLIHDLGRIAVLAGKVGRANNGLITLLPWGNSRGALDMGVRPHHKPGYITADQRGLGAREIWNAVAEKQMRGMYVMGIDPVYENPASREALSNLDFLVVQDLFLTETAQMADVVLPSAAFAERDGTYTNAERRVQRARQARLPVGESLPDWMIVQRVAQACLAVIAPEMEMAANSGKGKARFAKAADAKATTFESGWGYVVVSEVADEIADSVPGYSGITHTKLAATGTGGIWGRQTNESFYYDGTNYTNFEGVGIQYPALVEQQRMTFSLAAREAKAPATDQKRSFVLIAERLLYDGDPLLRDSLLIKRVPTAYACLSAADAERLGIRMGDRVLVESSVGALELPARVKANVPTGSVVVPANLPDAPLAAVQTGPQTSVSVRKV